jgi:hypothetical protein
MNIERYGYKTDSPHLDYEFFSVGPNGRIKKVVRFRLIDAANEIYNLGFGDYDDETGDINDLSVSNNSDREKILATVAAIVVYFSKHYTSASVFVQGSTSSRTRLYRMGITTYYDEINSLFDIFGYTDRWIYFQNNIEFNAFLIRVKN